jgi:flagellar biosynthesis protein FliR
MTISIAQFQMFLLAFTRIMAILIQVPVLGGRLIPNEVKIALGVLLTLILVPVAMPHLFPLPPETPSMSLFVLGRLRGFAHLRRAANGQRVYERRQRFHGGPRL